MNNNLKEDFNRCLYNLESISNEAFKDDYYTVDEMKKFLHLYRQLKTWQILSNNRIYRDHTISVPNLTDAKSKEESCYNCIFYNGYRNCKKNSF